MSYVSHMSLSISGVKILTIIINIYIYYNSAYKSLPHDSKTLMTPMTCMTPMTHSGLLPLLTRAAREVSKIICNFAVF